MRAYLPLTAALVVLSASIGIADQLKKEATAIDKADPYVVAIAKGVDYLTLERPTWNGDAMRALLVADAKGYDIGTALDDTLAFLKQPSKWDQSTAPAGVDNPSLARLQFASALAIAERHGKAAASDLEAAAQRLVTDQAADGSWQPDPSPTLGSPLTYGTIIATWSARSTLIASGMQPDNFTIVQADRWIRGVAPESVLDAAGTILALELSSDVMAENLRRTCLSILRSGQSPAGGWGPHVAASPQIFDTAVAVLALSSLEVEPRLARSAYRAEELKEAIANGKKYLVAQQRPDGSWPETTRPPNQESYAHRIATTGWALLALMTP